MALESGTMAFFVARRLAALGLDPVVGLPTPVAPDRLGLHRLAPGARSGSPYRTTTRRRVVWYPLDWIFQK